MQQNYNKHLISIFSTCKPFKGLDNIMQRNAISSWCNLDVPIILIGDDEGTGKTCHEFSLLHIDNVRSTAKGTPLISDIFLKGINNSNTPYIIYINSDIIITPKTWEKIIEAIELSDKNEPVFISSRRKNIPLYRELNWKENGLNYLNRLDQEFGSWEAECAIDIFVFSRGLFESIPDFAIARMQWDNWLLWCAKNSGADIIDISLEAAIYHPIHGYNHTVGGWQEVTQGSEAVENRKLAGGNAIGLDEAISHYLKDGQLITKDKLPVGTREVCIPEPVKEFKAIIKYMLLNLEIWPQKQLVDYSITILWRNQKFLTLDFKSTCTKSDLSTILKSVKEKDSDLNSALYQLQALINNEFVSHLCNLGSRPIYIWGAGQAGQRLLQFLKQQKIKVSGFFDKNPDIIGEVIEGVKVYSATPKITKDINKENCFIIPASIYAREIASELNTLGLKHYDDYVC